MKLYVIITSWHNVLYKLDAWSKNLYIAKTYLAKHSEEFPHHISTLVTYECENILEFAKLLKTDLDASLDDIIGSDLKLLSSKDGLMCIIYKSRYNDSFDTNMMRTKTLFSCINRVILSTTPLVRYLNEVNTGFDLLELLFLLYQYLLNHTGADNIDPVYLWYFILKTRYTNCIIDSTDDTVPIDAVFVRVD